MKRSRDWAAAFALLLLNVAIAGRLFRVEYSANLASNEGEFIAIARGVASHMGDLGWWRQWDCGIPFQNTYLPLLHVLVGLFSRLSGHSPALAFHQVTAALLCLGPVFLYAMARVLTGRPGASFLAAAVYSLVSPCALIPAIRTDLGGWWNVRRIQILGFYGEGPITAAMAFLPLAILFLYLAVTRGRFRAKVLAGVFVGATVLSNAFGVVILACAVAALLVYGVGLRRNVLVLAAIAILTYLWISPALPPSVISAIHMNSPTVDGDYRFTARSLAGALILAGGFAALWLASRRAPPHVRFFLLFAWLTTGIVSLGTMARVYVFPQPHRYQVAMDMGLCLLVVFGGAWLLGRISPRAVPLAAAALVLALGLQTRHAIRYAHSQIHSTDITKTAVYRMSRWMDANMRGARAFVGGSYSFCFNDFTDTPQLHGGQDPMLPNFMFRIAVFTIYSGMNTGARDAEISILWLKGLGAHAVHVPGPRSEEAYKPFANPRKFEGVLPVLWREGDDTVYAVPAASDSLAHVMTPGDLVRDPPVNGLDTAQLERYVAALDSASYPAAEWRWTSRHSATIRARIAPGQVVSIQTNYHSGWRATAGGGAQPTFKDGLGFLAVKPTCQGPCEITLSYDGGPEWRTTCAASLGVMLLLAGLAVFRNARDLDLKRRKPPA